MPEIIPFVPSVAQQRIEITLAGVACMLDVRWNGRDAAWYLDAFESDGRPILRSIKVNLGVELGRTSTHPLFRGRSMVAHDRSDSGRDAGFDDLGARVVIMYLNAADIEIAQSP